MRDRLDRLEARLVEIDASLSAEDATHDLDAYRRLMREHAELGEVVTQWKAWRAAEADLQTGKSMRDAGGVDPEMRAFAEEEVASATQRLTECETRLERLLLPRDPDDHRSAFIEIRAGTGGDESALFAADLLRMYLRYAERCGWRTEIVSGSPSDLGGWREVIVRVDGSENAAANGAMREASHGSGVYGGLKFESGGHRVQRVPETETQGRIHTSACTVAILPVPDEREEISIASEDLRIDTFRASGAGGQHINKTDSAVRITHLPTGLVVECQDDRSQHRNKDRAMQVLAARLRDRERREREAREASTRRSLIGSGDRSERIRTYNFPQGRITDHRINLTLHRLAAVMEGDLEEISTALANEYQAEQLAALADEV